MEKAVMLPIICGALLWIVDMLLPDDKIARAAGAVAGVIAMYAIIMPLLIWLGGAGMDADAAEDAYVSAAEVLSAAQD